MVLRSRLRRLKAPWNYVAALGITAVAFAVRLGALPMGKPFLIVFVLPAALAAFLGGLGPALVSAAASAAMALYLIPSGGRPSAATGVDVAVWALFCLTAAVVAYITDAAYTAGARLEATARTASRLEAQRRAQEARLESEQRFRAIFDDAGVGMVEVDHRDRLVALNRRMCDLLGYRRDELVGRTVQELTAPEDREITRELYERLHAGDQRVVEYEKRYLRRDGTRLWVHVSMTVVRDREGRFVRGIATAQDIGERKRAEEALRDADRRKDEFLGMLSHELRNPLAPIRNALFILDHAEPTGPQAQRAKEIAARQIAHMTRLVDDLLDVTRIARGKIELRREEIDVGLLVRRTAEDHRALLHDRSLTLALEVPRTPLLVTGDETRLAQVLGNLLHNAAKFTPARGNVTLAATARRGAVEIAVRDTGPGIAPDVLPTIFEPFTQAEQTLARSEGGLGLGLALVKGLVELHGGTVSASSGGEGRGTEFVVSLPRAPASPAREAEPAPSRSGAPGGRQRVLVVDDNRDAADTLAQLVEMLGHAPVVAYDAVTGLAEASETLPDVVLCDIGLPGMDGYEFARRLRAQSPQADVRLVAVSGYAQPEDVARAFEAGFDAHVAKPPDPERLAGLLAADPPSLPRAGSPVALGRAGSIAGSV